MTPPAAPPSLVPRRPRARAAALLGALLAVAGGCAVGRTPLRPAPGSDLAMPEGTTDRLVRGLLSGCDTARVRPAEGGTAADADRCRRGSADSAGRVRPDTVARVPRVP
ncbi:hypothetical protein [Roseisolibacter sp. H3M3-2]|uniref:hypothetical protein n=1 Tax=Roseisolibacter sp. H3M3-2 TaxID=3031323 RepID=UPI0023D9FFE9|nr:hypothetical protein [Roseisolibacter sp. H3M3-2]MDF1505822.1 hypothetical protein [Roseisolibacter sp. H3M3-2]